MSGIRISLVKRAHAYTSVDVPWRLETDDVEASTRSSYFRTGGVRAYGETSAQTAVERRQTRFLVVMAALFTAWFLAWIF